MSRYIGNYLRVPSLEPQQSSASGIWSINEQLAYQRANVWPPARDPYYNQTVLHLSGDVAATRETNPVTQPRTFLSDASTNNFVVSPNGDVSARPFNPYLNNYGNYFGGDGNYLSAAYSTDWAFSGDFSIEAWINVQDAGRSNDAIKTGTIIGQGASGSTTDFWGFYFIISGGVITNVTFELGSSTLLTVSSQSISLNTWHHFVVCRSGSTLSIFVDGTRIGVNASYSIAIAANTSGTLQLARSPYGSPYQNWTRGYFSNVRILNGSSAYTATQTSITVPTAPLTAIANTKLLTCQANRFIDTNTQVAAKTITVTGSPAVSQNSPFVSYDTTNGSGYFDGNGDYLSILDNDAFDFGIGDFTISAWVYPTISGGAIIDQGGGGASTNRSFEIFMSNTSTISNAYITSSGSYQSQYNLTGTTTPNAWNFIEFTRSSGTIYLFVNGVQQSSAPANITVYNSTANVFIGETSQSVGNNFGGYISNVRVRKGTGSSSSTVPTAPLQAVTNTSLLTLQTRAPATNNGFIDSSPNNFVVTRNGNTTQGSFSPFSPTGWSNYFAGPTNYLSFSSSLFALGTDGFTIEGWIYLTAYSYSAIFSTWLSAFSTNNGIMLGTNSSGNLELNIGNAAGGGSQNAISASVIPLNTWVFIQGTKAAGSGGALKIYINGNDVTPSTITTTRSVNLTSGVVGRYYVDSSNHGINGYISNVRVSNTVRSSTVPTAPFAVDANTVFLSCQANRFRDGGPGNVSLTVNGSPSVQAFSPFAPAQSYTPSQIGGSGYFDGISDYLSGPTNTASSFNLTGDFTVECWAYFTSASTAGQGLVTWADSGGWNGWQFINDAGTIKFEFLAASSAAATVTGGTVVNNQWYHLAVVRNGSGSNNVVIYINGASSGSPTTYTGTQGTSASSFFRVGVDRTATNEIVGYISGARVVNGTALYTSSFTVPTAPPTAIPNTSLLLNFTNGGIVDATGKNNLETVGNSYVQTKVLKYGNGSMAFDKTTDTVVAPASVLLAVGSGDYTYDFWVYANSFSNTPVLFDTRVPIASLAGLQLSISTGGVLTLYGGATTGTLLITASNTLVISQWYYVMLVRSGTGANNTVLYVDGVSRGSVQDNTSYSTGQGVSVGSLGPAGTNCLDGYISNFRVTRTARSTTSVPTGPFPLA